MAWICVKTVGAEDRPLMRGQTIHGFPTYDDARLEADRRNAVAKHKGVPWRYVAMAGDVDLPRPEGT